MGRVKVKARLSETVRTLVHFIGPVGRQNIVLRGFKPEGSRSRSKSENLCIAVDEYRPEESKGRALNCIAGSGSSYSPDFLTPDPFSQGVQLTSPVLRLLRVS